MMEVIILSAMVEAILLAGLILCIAIIMAIEPTGIAIVNNTTCFICSMLKPILAK